MAAETVLAATWTDGLFVCHQGERMHELAGQPVTALASDGAQGALAIVGGHDLYRRDAGGAWAQIAHSELDLACCVAVGEDIVAGTNCARLLRIDRRGAFEMLTGFDAVPGRDRWYAGTALINGKLLGPPLGVRSIAASADGAVLFANVHVGGIPRSTDGGRTWEPTIDVEHDVHEVRVHPRDNRIVAAAAAVGLCLSRDGGATWEVCDRGLHAPYCSAVAILEDQVLVSASEDPFSKQGAIYRATVAGGAMPSRLGGVGFPEWLQGIADTRCIATRGSTIAIADRASDVYVSLDAGANWSPWASGLSAPSALLVV